MTALRLILILFVAIGINACNDPGNSSSPELSGTPRKLQEATADQIRSSIKVFLMNNGWMPDSVRLSQPDLVNLLYEKTASTPIWCHEEKWLSFGDSLFSFIENAKLYGLFPQDYHFEQVAGLRQQFFADSLAKQDRRDPQLWSKADILLTDAFMQIIHDVKLGRLPADSLTQRKDSVLSNDFYLNKFDELQRHGNLTMLIADLEPRHRGYQLLKEGIKRFLDSADNKTYTFVPPSTDSLYFRKALQKRLFEGGYLSFDSIKADSAQLATAIKKFQQQKNITADGRAGEATIRLLNVNDRERFIRIAISMDKYKLLPETMPEEYIWVNTPANWLEVVSKGAVAMTSKVICGRPKTRTPLLTSAITELVTYPQWVPPSSIIAKEILPAVKKNPGYLSRKGFSLVDKDGNEVDPYSINWSKYSRSMPYKVVQGSGDANALGVMKFVFNNKYSVYLHDTNQRYLFNNSSRSLSHGCVRVQEWEKLACYILRNDSLRGGGNNYTSIDSMRTWLSAKKKKTIAVRNRMPVFIRYFTCEGRDGKLVFYDDVYGEDRMLREKYFASK